MCVKYKIKTKSQIFFRKKLQIREETENFSF